MCNVCSDFIFWQAASLFYTYTNALMDCRYTYFPCSRRQFGLQGPSLLEIDHDERPEEGTLASSLSVRLYLNLPREIVNC